MYLIKNATVYAPGMDADLCFLDQNLTLRHVMARGRFLMRDGEVVVKGEFEA